MNTRIQELTDIIYNEGVVKGQEEADRILAEANEKARTILAEARKNANEILTNAGKESAANAENVRKELKLYASQAISALKSEITTVISDKVISDSVKGFTANQNDFNAFILSLAAEWAGERILSSQLPMPKSCASTSLPNLRLCLIAVLRYGR